MSRARERVSLDAFLAPLSDEDAGAARAAAARIDDLARVGAAIEGIERRFLPWAIGGAVLFVLGLWLLIHPGVLPGPVMTLSLAALPGVAATYAWRVRDRTKADNAAEALNREHFLPHGGLYFPADERGACVVRVDYTPPPPELPLSQAPRDPRKKAVRAGRIW